MTKNDALNRIQDLSVDAPAIADAIGDYTSYLDKDEAICKLRLMLLNISQHLTAEQMRVAWQEACGDFHGFGV